MGSGVPVAVWAELTQWLLGWACCSGTWQACAAGKITKDGDSFKVVPVKKAAPKKTAPKKKVAPKKKKVTKKKAAPKKKTTKKATKKKSTKKKSTKKK